MSSINFEMLQLMKPSMQNNFYSIELTLGKCSQFKKIKETTEETRQLVATLIKSRNEENLLRTRELVEKLQKSQQTENFDERNLTKWKQELNELKLLVSQLDIYVDEQKSTDPFIMKIFASEKDVFEQTCGDVCIQDNGLLACHTFNLFGNSGELRGKKQYRVGVHRIRFKIDNLDIHPWWFFGIISKSASMQTNSECLSSAYGWTGHDYVYVNGKPFKKMNGYTSDYSTGDIIELTIDCEHHQIQMTNIRSKKSNEININLSHCPLPWMLHLNLFHIQTRIRINPFNQ